MDNDHGGHQIVQPDMGKLEHFLQFVVLLDQRRHLPQAQVDHRHAGRGTVEIAADGNDHDQQVQQVMRAGGGPGLPRRRAGRDRRGYVRGAP
ncbi:hypothetical protein D9M72_503050 [compost metagenome]